MKVNLRLELILLTMKVFISCLHGSPVSPVVGDSNPLSTHKLFQETQNTQESNHINYEQKLHRHSKEFKHLRYKLDKMSVKQNIDRIQIEILEQKLNKMEKLMNNFLDYNSFQNIAQNFNGEKNDKKYQKTNFEKYLKPLLVDEQKKEDVQQEENNLLQKINEQEKNFQEERNHLRAEISELKESCKKCSLESSLPNSRDHSSVKWIMQLIPNLQKNVEELQETTNIVQAMHEKQDIGTKLQLLIEDTKKQQQSIISVTSEVEATRASVDTLSSDFKEASSRINELETTVVQLKETLNEEKSTIDELLQALPDGFLSKHPNEDQKSDKKSRSILDEGIPDIDLGIAPKLEAMKLEAVNEQVKKLQLQTSSLDFALMNLQKKVFFQTNNITLDDSPIPITKEKDLVEEKGNRIMSKRLGEIEFELSKLKDSSEAVLNTLSMLEIRKEASIKSIDEKLSKVETQIEKEKEDRSSNNIDTVSDIVETKSEIRDDYVELKNEIIYLKNKFKSNKDNKSIDHLNREIAKNSIIDKEILQSKIKDICFDIVRHENKYNNERLSNLETKLEKIEKVTRKNSNFFHRRKRHRHGLKKS